MRDHQACANPNVILGLGSSLLARDIPPVYNASMNSQLKRVLILGILAVALSTCATAPKTPAEPRPTGTGQVQVTVTGFESEEGQVLVALFLDESGWPDDEQVAFGATVLPIRERQAVAEFKGVPAGAFAISVFHDEDSDRELDTGVFGIPSEDYGFSRGARGSFGPPSFDDARLDLMEGESKQVAIRVE
jgi:uncharacterized protein (DUF2141 family)